MADKKRQILRGVILHQRPDVTFVDGMEDDLEALMSPAQLKRLEETGSLAGDWSAKGKDEKMATARADKQTPKFQALKSEKPDITTPTTTSEPAPKHAEHHKPK